MAQTREEEAAPRTGTTAPEGCEGGLPPSAFIGSVASPQGLSLQLSSSQPEIFDGVTVMTVHPGRGGQAFLPEMLPKVTALRALLDERGLGASIEVDGGVKANNAAACVAAGADMLVAGSAVFNDAETPQHALASLRARQRSVASEGLPPASG